MKNSLRLTALTIVTFTLLLSACSTKNSVKKVPRSNNKNPILLFNKVEARIGKSTFKELNKQLKQIKPALKLEIVEDKIQVNLSSSKKSYILLTFDNKQKLQIIEGFYFAETAELKDIVTKIINRKNKERKGELPALDVGFFSYTRKGTYGTKTEISESKLFKLKLTSELWKPEEKFSLQKAFKLSPYLTLFSKVSLRFGLSKESVKNRLIKAAIKHTIITNRINIKLPNYRNSFFKLDFNKHNQFARIKLELHTTKEEITEIAKKMKISNDPSHMHKQNLHFIIIPHMFSATVLQRYNLNLKKKKPAEFKIKIWNE